MINDRQCLNDLYPEELLCDARGYSVASGSLPRAAEKSRSWVFWPKPKELRALISAAGSLAGTVQKLGGPMLMVLLARALLIRLAKLPRKQVDPHNQLASWSCRYNTPMFDEAIQTCDELAARWVRELTGEHEAAEAARAARRQPRPDKPAADVPASGPNQQGE